MQGQKTGDGKRGGKGFYSFFRMRSGKGGFLCVTRPVPCCLTNRKRLLVVSELSPEFDRFSPPVFFCLPVSDFRASCEKKKID
ncbi:hypothetical protein ABH19_04700 [Leptospirillum sp. Group II 'CF-1']|nr:hypothetical protein ABH19_04700 [Leptospirillum sp. Group II 'CF-1']